MCQRVSQSKHAWSSTLPFDMSFRPWFVDKAFQKWHVNYNFKAFDNVSLRLDLVIWLACWATAPSQSLLQMLTALCCLAAVLALALHQRYPDFYTKHRTAITTARRMLTLPYVQQLAVRAGHPSGPVSAAVLHLLVKTGALHNFVGSLFFLDGWRVAAINSLVGFTVLRSTVRPSCSQLLAGPFADSAAWRRLAAALDRAAAGVFRRKLHQPALALAVCSTTVSSMQVLLSCASVYATFLIERGYRLRFKQQHLPASVAAMQGHVYALPWWLELPQVLLQLWVPLVLTWLAAGAWYGLATAS